MALPSVLRSSPGERWRCLSREDLDKTASLGERPRRPDVRKGAVPRGLVHQDDAVPPSPSLPHGERRRCAGSWH